MACASTSFGWLEIGFAEHTSTQWVWLTGQMIVKTTKEETMVTAKEYREVYKEFYEIFHLKLGEYIESELFVATGQVFLNICKFDDVMLDTWKYDEDKQSLQDVVLEHYGERGNNLIEKLL